MRIRLFIVLLILFSQMDLSARSISLSAESFTWEVMVAQKRYHDFPSAVTERNDYHPYGARHSNSSLTKANGNRWRFSGKEEFDDAFGLPQSDFGARFYDRAAWSSIDPLAEKYYSLSPYAFCAGNPIIFVDRDGRDFSISVKGKVIYISAAYYYPQGDATSHKSLTQAISYWNNRLDDKYTNEHGVTYSIVYNLYAIPSSKIKNSKGNTYIVDDSLIDNPIAAGQTKDKRKIVIRHSYSLTIPNKNEKSTTGAHEIGHTLGMGHADMGIMTKSQNSNRNNALPPENIEQMMNSDNGRMAFWSRIIYFVNNFKQKINNEK